ncbi:hypothetical protein MGWOODY_Clf2960 [hydrothermal vent metagenome]|uniref:Uncharacterized protein n=1 Tax=hydrothermal vent metagenome TaxID=652676 RepID=A0A160VBU1_9ZZZZ
MTNRRMELVSTDLSEFSGVRIGTITPRMSLPAMMSPYLSIISVAVLPGLLSH